MRASRLARRHTHQTHRTPTAALNAWQRAAAHATTVAAPAAAPAADPTATAAPSAVAPPAASGHKLRVPALISGRREGGPPKGSASTPSSLPQSGRLKAVEDLQSLQLAAGPTFMMPPIAISRMPSLARNSSSGGLGSPRSPRGGVSPLITPRKHRAACRPDPAYSASSLAHHLSRRFGRAHQCALVPRDDVRMRGRRRRRQRAPADARASRGGASGAAVRAERRAAYARRL